MLEWWNGLSQTNRVTFIVPVLAAVLAAAGYFAKRWFEKRSPPANSTTNTASDEGIIQQTDGGSAVTHTGTGDVVIGLTQAEYEKRLNQREEEITTQLKEGHAKERDLLETQFNAVQQRLQDTKTSYEAHIDDLRIRINELESLRGHVADDVLSRAKAALARGDTKEADELFRRVEEQTTAATKVAAQAAHQRCQIALDEIRYRPGELAHILGQYQKAIGYFEQALANTLKIYDEDHPEVATTRHNLGSAWQALGEYQKAIGYFEQALASDLKTYGEDHPQVAIYHNNLGLAWQGMGAYQKAIGCFEQALASALKIYDEDHPSTRTAAENLSAAKAASSQPAEDRGPG